MISDSGLLFGPPCITFNLFPVEESPSQEDRDHVISVIDIRVCHSLENKYLLYVRPAKGQFNYARPLVARGSACTSRTQSAKNVEMEYRRRTL